MTDEEQDTIIRENWDRIDPLKRKMLVHLGFQPPKEGQQ